MEGVEMNMLRAKLITLAVFVIWLGTFGWPISSVYGLIKDNTKRTANENSKICDPSCNIGSKCVEGECVSIAELDCSPRCKAGAVCQNGRCVTDLPISALILKRMEIGFSNEPYFVLNKGSANGIVTGMSGTFDDTKGVTFTIVKVYPYRSIATSESPYQDIRQANSVTIQSD